MTQRKRRRALMAWNASVDAQYASGLGLHLDAINNTGTGHDASFKDWVDLANGKQFAQSGSTAFAEKYFPFSGSEYFEVSSGSKNWGTMEVVIDPDDSATRAVFQTAATGSGTFGTVSIKSGAVLFSAGGARSTNIVSGRHTYACDGTNVYVDGVVAQSANVTVSFTGLISQWRVGAWRGTGYLFKGKVYSIRCYERSLTAAEIANNAAVDAARFG